MTHWGAFRRVPGAVSKYGNKPKRCRRNLMHQSTAEARRCDELHLMQAGGLIRDLQAHPQRSFDLTVNGHAVCRYLADFAYHDLERDEPVVEDVKGFRTEVYRLKCRLMLAVHGIEIREVR